jgi:hypothetical protein
VRISIDPNLLFGTDRADGPERLYGNSRRMQFEPENTTSIDAAIAEFGGKEWSRALTKNAY